MGIDEILDNHQERLMALPGVVGVGIGNKDGQPSLVIMVKQVTPDLKMNLPQSIEGCPVVIEETGEISAF